MTNTKFKVGDKVRIVARVDEAEGWNDVWVDYMDENLGLIGVITEERDGGYVVGDVCKNNYCYPAEALELIDSNKN